MPRSSNGFTVKSHFEGKEPGVRKTYDQLLKAVQKFGPIAEEAKKTSIHLVNKTAFAGIATLKTTMILTVKSDRPLASPRIFKSEQTSANRFHHELKLASPGEVDTQVLKWLKDAYNLSG